jgi:hypothetical protein
MVNVEHAEIALAEVIEDLMRDMETIILNLRDATKRAHELGQVQRARKLAKIGRAAVAEPRREPPRRACRCRGRCGDAEGRPPTHGRSAQTAAEKPAGRRVLLGRRPASMSQPVIEPYRTREFSISHYRKQQIVRPSQPGLTRASINPSAVQSASSDRPSLCGLDLG